MALHEIAIEPTSLQTLRDVQLVLGYAGFAKGRLIANFPERGPSKEKADEDWAWRVVQSVKKTQVGKAIKVRELLIHERTKIIRSKRYFDHGIGWIENARREHTKTPFGAIVTEDPGACDAECALDDFSGDNLPHSLREDQHVQALPKRPKMFAEALMPMLRWAKALRFVDPYLMRINKMGELQFSNAHAKVVQEISRQLNMLDRVPNIIEFHLKSLTNEPQEQLLKFAEGMKEHLPKSWTARAFLWKDGDGTRRFHARYILTDLGGAGSDYGLDQGNSMDDETDLYLLPEPLRARRSSEFSETGVAFHRATEPIVFSGIR